MAEPMFPISEPEPGQCYYHVKPFPHRPAVEIVRLTCPICGDFRVVSVCSGCANGIRSRLAEYDRRGYDTHTCRYCCRSIQVNELWAPMGKV